MNQVNFPLDALKAKAAILYIAERLENREMHLIFKILYFAERSHLAQYGRPITGDSFIAMDFGPVPSHIYDKVKQSRNGETAFMGPSDLALAIDVENQYHIMPKQEADLDEFSDSDIECIDRSIEENRNLNFNSRTDKSHDEAWTKTYKHIAKNHKIDFLDIAKAGGANEDMLKAIQVFSENLRITI